MKGYTVMGDFSRFEEAIRRGFMLLLVTGTTDTSLIPGLTIAGASPDLTHFTPAADAEYLIFGKTKSVPGIPVTPDGKPTPAILTRSALSVIDAGALVVNAGTRVKPLVPIVELGGSPGRDIRTGSAIDEGIVRQAAENARELGKNLGKRLASLIVGESIPAGTTTAMAFLAAMGYDPWDRMSSASPENPKKLKTEIVKEALTAAGIRGAVADPVVAAAKVGDPVIPAIAAIAAGAAEVGSVVVLAGGTQMAAVLAFLRAYDARSLSRVSVATTRWLIEDRTADLRGLIQQVSDVPLAYSLLGFEETTPRGLRAFEAGFVKEGAAAGGALVAAAVLGIPLERLKEQIVGDYLRVLGKG